MSPAHVEERDTLIALGYLFAEDRGDLRLYHYTDRCVRERAWNEVTLESRGHIFHRATGECVARPFRKFFNLGEGVGLHEHELPWERADLVAEKVDGWMGTLYRDERGEPAVATSGSMASAVARMATAALSGHHFNLDGLDETLTLVWEITSPQTRVVIDYGPAWRMTLLAAFDRYSGGELAWHEVERIAGRYQFALPRVLYRADEGGGVPFDRIAREFADPPAGGLEGFVVRFSGRAGEPSFRVKLKSPAYMAALRQRSREGGNRVSGATR